MTTALVTGATGFTGGALCRRLRDDGVRVVALVRNSSDTSELERLGVECRVVDLTDPASVRSRIPPATVVYHLAAAFRIEHPDRDVFHRVNVGGTRNLLDAAAAAGIERFVHCSTVGVQGEIERPPATEEAPPRPGDHYQRSKLEGEQLALAYRDTISVRVARPVGIYGPGDTRFLKLFRAIARGRFVMIGRGGNLYHLTYIDDVVEGLLRVGAADAAAGEVFTLCGPEHTTVAELVGEVARALDRPPPRWRVPMAPVLAASVVCERLCRTVGVAPPLYPRRLDFFSKDRAFDGGKAARLVGFRARVSLRDGLTRTAEWYAGNGLLG